MPDAFDRALRAAARRGRPAGVCPDAETLAAYADGRLPDDERRTVEAHAADCTVCVQHLALLGSATADDGSPAPPRPWLVRWGWMVPVATAVLVVAVWTRLPDEPAMPAPTGVRQEAARSKGADELSDAAKRRESLSDYDAARKAPTDTPRLETPSSTPSRAQIDGRREIAPQATPAEKAAAAQAGEQAQAASSYRAPAPPRGAAEPSTPAVPELPPPTTGPAAPVARDSVSAPPARAAGRAENEARADALMSVERDTPVVVAGWARDWYRASGGRIEVSPDGGATWREAFTDRTVTFTAAACAAGGACWFGTSGGEVFRNEPDGFVRSALPAPARVVAVAPGPNGDVSVTVDGGARFRSTDGGRTWSREP